MLKKLAGNALCLFGLHKKEFSDKSCGFAGGMYCGRPNCSWKIDAIKWPCPPTRPV